MRKLLLLELMYVLLAIGTANADVSNELVVGWEQDSSSKFRSTINGVTTDLTKDVKIGHSLYTAVYRHFFEPLKDDDTPVDLRGFFQHPSTMFAALSSENSFRRDAGSPGTVSTGARHAIGLDIGGELFLQGGTGLSFALGGSVATSDPSADEIKPETVGYQTIRCLLGVRQYVAPNAELHVAMYGETAKPINHGSGATIAEANILLGGRVVVNSVVGFSLEAGKGVGTFSGDIDVDYAIVVLNAELDVYATKQLTFRLAFESKTLEKPGQPDGTVPGKSWDRTTLAGRYWFSERFSLEVPIYTATEKERTINSFGDVRTTTRSNGAGLYAAYRF